MSPLDIAGSGQGPMASGLPGQGGAHGKHHHRADRDSDHGFRQMMQGQGQQPPQGAGAAPDGVDQGGSPVAMALQVLAQIMPVIEQLLEAALPQGAGGAAAAPGLLGGGDPGMGMGDPSGAGGLGGMPSGGSPYGNVMSQSSGGPSMSMPLGPDGSLSAQANPQQMSQSLAQLESQVMEHLQEAIQALQQAVAQGA